MEGEDDGDSLAYSISTRETLENQNGSTNAMVEKLQQLLVISEENDCMPSTKLQRDLLQEEWVDNVAQLTGWKRLTAAHLKTGVVSYRQDYVRIDTTLFEGRIDIYVDESRGKDGRMKHFISHYQVCSEAQLANIFLLPTQQTPKHMATIGSLKTKKQSESSKSLFPVAPQPLFSSIWTHKSEAYPDAGPLLLPDKYHSSRFYAGCNYQGHLQVSPTIKEENELRLPPDLDRIRDHLLPLPKANQSNHQEPISSPQEKFSWTDPLDGDTDYALGGVSMLPADQMTPPGFSPQRSNMPFEEDSICSRLFSNLSLPASSNSESGGLPPRTPPRASPNDRTDTNSISIAYTPPHSTPKRHNIRYGITSYRSPPRYNSPIQQTSTAGSNVPSAPAQHPIGSGPSNDVNYPIPPPLFASTRSSSLPCRHGALCRTPNCRFAHPASMMMLYGYNNYSTRRHQHQQRPPFPPSGMGSYYI